MYTKIFSCVSILFIMFSPVFSQRKSSKEVYKVVDQMPKFSDCVNEDASDEVDCSELELFKFMGENLLYPRAALMKGTSGKVYVQFIVEKNGSLSDINVVRDIGDDCGDAALELMNYMNNIHSWIPGRKDGKVVRVIMTLPIVFKQELKEFDVEGDIYKVVDVMPRFPGCESIKDSIERRTCSNTKLFEFIFQNIYLTEEAKANRIDRKSYTQFVIYPDGKISDINIVRKVGYGCDEIVLNMMEKMKSEITWIPGYKDGKAVKVFFTLPIQFKRE